MEENMDRIKHTETIYSVLTPPYTCLHDQIIYQNTQYVCLKINGQQ